MIAPILTFTAEEIWQSLPANLRTSESILLENWYEENQKNIDTALDEKWSKIITLRGSVNKVLESLRKDKIIGHSLNAEVKLYSEDAEYAKFLNEVEKELEDVFIVSKSSAVSAKDDTFVAAEEVKGLYIFAGKAAGEKCERCWKFSENLGTSAEHPTLCQRCTEVLK